ncbi:MAG: aldo/keto reductase [Ruminococcaceae bacterium]|nr:aldo/keto reductase [Oscillospiraceae bacterium]
MTREIPKVILSPRLPAVSRLAVGSLTVSKMQGALPLDTAASVLAYAFDSGLNFIDTAQYYENYDIINLALKKCAHPEDIVLSTKTYAYSRELAIAAVEEARRECGRDVIDIFMLHEQESYETLRGHMEALEYLFECREKGIIKAVGASTHHVNLVRGLIRLKNEGFTPDVCHPLYNMAGIGIADGDECDMASVLQDAHDTGIGIFAMKALGGGHLCASAEDALKFVLEKPFIDSVAVGMQSFEEVDANIRFLCEGHFSPTDKERLESKKRVLHVEEYCEGCGACVERCGEGALRLVEVEGDYTSDYDFSSDFVPRVKDDSIILLRAEADDSKCVRCGYCTKVCPVFALKIW